MTIKRISDIPTAFRRAIEPCSKADLQEILWDVMCQSPWFNETTASENPALVGQYVMDIRKALKEGGS